MESISLKPVNMNIELRPRQSRGRPVDETAAARNPVLRWTPPDA